MNRYSYFLIAILTIITCLVISKCNRYNDSLSSDIYLPTVAKVFDKKRTRYGNYNDVYVYKIKNDFYVATSLTDISEVNDNYLVLYNKSNPCEHLLVSNYKLNDSLSLGEQVKLDQFSMDSILESNIGMHDYIPSASMNDIESLKKILLDKIIQ